MSALDQAAIDAAWGDTVARVSSQLTPAAVVPSMLSHGAERLHRDGAGSQAATDAMWSAAVAKASAEAGFGATPSDGRPGGPHRSR